MTESTHDRPGELAAAGVDSPALIHWSEGGQQRSALWRSERGAPPPKSVVIADDRMPADRAYGLACQGTALLWRGDFHNARQLLVALAKRADRRRPRASTGGPASRPPKAPASLAEAFNLERQARSQRARTLGMLLVELDSQYRIALRRAPDLRPACEAAWGSAGEASVVALRELQGVIGAYEWRRKGIPIPAAGGRIHPHYGVFPPTRGEYVDLVAEAPLPAALRTLDLAFDIGTGTGVLAAVLARRGVGRVVATDLDPRALACASENFTRFGIADRVSAVEADLFPEGRAALAVCNPPWVPGRPSAPLENAIYDPGSRMLLGFLRELPAHLAPGGEGWLILSDLAEHLGLRSRDELLSAFDAAGLTVLGRLDARAKHPRAFDRDDRLHAARAAEITSLWRLAPR